MNWQIESLTRTDLARFSYGLVMVLREMRSALTSRIDKNGAQPSASGAGSAAVNGCAAHSSRRLLTLGPKTCSLFALITNNTVRYR